MRACAGLLAAALALGLAARHAAAAPGAGVAPGTVVERVLAVAGKQVPLPEGPWVVAGVGHESFAGDLGGGAYGAIANLVLFRLRGAAIDAALELNLNELPVADGWGLAADCERRDLALAVVRYKTGWDGSCFFVTHTLATAPAPSAAWAQALRFAADAELVGSPVWLTAGFRVAGRRDVVDARFHFSPTQRGVPVEVVARWSDSAWHAGRLAADPRRAALAAAVARWAAVYVGQIEAGMKNRLDPNAPGPPMPEAAHLAAQGDGGGFGGGDAARDRLAALEAQRAAGLLGEPQFQAQARWLGEHGARAGSQAVEPATAALAKALTYRPLAALAGAGLALLGGAEVAAVGAAAGAYGLLRAGLDTAVFYAHELGWERLGTRPRRDSARTVDFRYFGSGA